MNINNEEKTSETPLNTIITEALVKLSKKDSIKEGVDLLDITKKISDKKFGKKV